MLEFMNYLSSPEGPDTLLALHRLSVGGFELNRPRISVSGFSKNLSWVGEGFIQSFSGYLAISNPYDVNLGHDLIDYLHRPAREGIKKFGKPTKILQGEDFIELR